LVTDLQSMVDTLSDELNVKRVRFMFGGVGTDGASVVYGEQNPSGQPLMDFDILHYTVRLNLPVLGQKYGPQMVNLQRAFTSADELQLARRKLAGLPIAVGGFDLQSDELLVSTTGQPGYAVAEEAGYAVAVSTEITPELADEGLAREIVRHVQELRKNAGFEISDRIRVHYDGDDDIARVMQSWRDYISSETLAQSLARGVTTGPGFTAEELIDGHETRLSVEKD
jgi:isoleucyl-tRNA synthetase